MTVKIRKDGEVVATVEDDNAAFAYVLKHQGQSVDYAVRYGGWSATDEDGRDVFPEWKPVFGPID